MCACVCISTYVCMPSNAYMSVCLCVIMEKQYGRYPRSTVRPNPFIEITGMFTSFKVFILKSSKVMSNVRSYLQTD